MPVSWVDLEEEIELPQYHLAIPTLTGEHHHQPTRPRVAGDDDSESDRVEPDRQVEGGPIGEHSAWATYGDGRGARITPDQGFEEDPHSVFNERLASPSFRSRSRFAMSPDPSLRSRSRATVTPEIREIPTLGHGPMLVSSSKTDAKHGGGDDDDNDVDVERGGLDLAAPAVIAGALSMSASIFLWARSHALGTAPAILSRARAGSAVDLILNAVPRGVSQVVFINNPWSGWLILAALAWDNWERCLAGVLALAFSTLTARVAGLNTSALRGGIFGYNALLLGLGMHLFLGGAHGWNLAAVAGMGSLCALVSAAIANLLVPVWKCPPFTLGFNACLLIAMGCVSHGTAQRFPGGSSLIEPPVYLADPSEFPGGIDAAYTRDAAKLTRAVLLGVGQIFFVGSSGPSALILGASAVGSPIIAAALTLGSACGLCIALFIGAPESGIEAGLWGYNPALACAAVALFYVPLLPLWLLLGIAASVLAAVIHGATANAMAMLRLPAGTLPFCFAGITFLLLQGALKNLVPVDLDKASTPEEHRAAWSLTTAAANAAANAKKVDHRS